MKIICMWTENICEDRFHTDIFSLPHLDTFTWQIVTPADRVTLPSRTDNPPRRVTPPSQFAM